MKLDKLFRTALQYKASDLYISSGSKPVLRIHGELVGIDEHPVLTDESAREYILDTMSEAEKKDFAESRDGDYSVDIPGVARFRANVYVQSRGISAVFRLIPSTVASMEDLNIPSQLKKILGYSNGIVLVTGPTGSGKSTTLASLVHEINRTRREHIVTIEDPIEFMHENKLSLIEQRDVGKHTKSFAKALRASLREDPDVILIGEMRDLETTALAITAAETGHLVLSTVHTSGAAKTIDRIIDAFPADQQNQVRTQFSESMRAIVWQTLVKKRDGTGRTGAFEILFNNHAIANMIRKKKTFQIQSVLETSVHEGMQTMKRGLSNLVEQGIITEETAQENMPEDIEV